MPKLNVKNENTRFKLDKYINSKEVSISILEKKQSFRNYIFTNYKEIKDIQDKDEKFLKIYYFNKERVHNILYKSMNTIDVNDETISKLKNLFYLDLLLNDEPNILNYEYSKESIILLCKELSNEKESPKKLIMSKIIIDLIESYKGIGNYTKKIDEQFLDELSKESKKEIKKIIKEEKKLFSCFNFEDVIENSIDKLYMDLILRVISNESFSFEFIYHIIDILELENINITEKMYKIFVDLINSDENTFEKYYIQKLEDLINIKKIHIYYIILKYILKNQIFIYDIPFLLNTRRLIRESIMYNLYILLVIIFDLDKSIKDKLDYIIKFIIDSDYYYDKYILMKNSVKEILNNEKLRYSFPLIYILIDNDINNIMDKTESILNKWEEYNKLIKEKKYKKIKGNKLNKLVNFFKDEKNKILLLKLFEYELYKFYFNLDLDINEENSNVECIQINNNNQSLSREDTFQKINDESSMIIQSYTIKDIKEDNIDSSFIYPYTKEYDLNLFKKSNKYKIIEFIKILEKNDTPESNNEIIKIISKGHYITGLNNNKLILYNSNFQKKLEIYLFKSFKKVYEIENKNNDGEIHLIVCLFKKLILVKINIHKYSYVYHPIYKGKINLLFQENNRYLLIGDKGGFKVNELDVKISGEKIFSENYIGGTKIRNNVYALISNDLFPGSENKLVIYDFSNNKILKQINNYSFYYASVDPYLLNNNKKEKLAFICTCTKKKKNGFLIVNINLEKKEKYFFDEFYETKEFEPYCYCQLSIIENNNSIYDDISNEEYIKIINTDYFVIGGFDLEKRIGIVKLYKMIYDKENNTKVKYLFDLNMEDDENQFKGFDMKVVSIQQSKTTGNLLISCLDGTVSLFKPPNFECL